MEILAYIIYSAITLFLLYVVFLQRQRNRRLASLNLQALMDLSLVKKELEKAVLEINNKKLEKDDGFVKFLSESRDWAYDYISTTQLIVEKFNSDITEIMESESKPSQKLSQIKKSCDELKKILPDEDKNIKEKQ